MRVVLILSGVLLLAGCASHRPPQANCWQSAAFVATGPDLVTRAADCDFLPLPGPAEPIDV